MDGLKEIFEENDIPAVFTGYPAMFSFSLGVDAVTCQRDWARATTSCISNWQRMAIECGVMPDHDAREPWFLCYEHSDADIDETLNVYAEIVKEGKEVALINRYRQWTYLFACVLSNTENHDQS
jgi:glutamate-1-semialdehyde aminotransferase